MKIAVAARSPSLDGEVEERFGLAAHLVLVDPDTMEMETVENPGWQVGGGSGVQAARLLVEHGVTAVASGGFGPNAHAALSAVGIAMYHVRAGTRAVEAVVEVKQEEPIGGSGPEVPPGDAPGAAERTERRRGPWSRVRARRDRGRRRDRGGRSSRAR